MNHAFLSTLAGGVGILVLVGSGCSNSKVRPATRPPHAFIKYTPAAEGDTNIRLAVKDLIDMKGEVTSAGSQLLFETAEPATKDAACLQYARRPDVTIVGKASLSEFAVGVSGCNAFFGTPENPIKPSRMPGGSSSGSAVAVALGLADVALGTDTAGSIRVPAACCGIAGLKTTFGLISTEGVHPIAPSYLDTVGPMAPDVKGLVTGMGLLQEGFANLYEQAKAAKPSAETIRIGRLYVPDTRKEIDRAIDKALAEAGFEVVPLDAAFLAAWKVAQEDGNRVAAAASWFSNQEYRGRERLASSTKKTVWIGDFVYKINYKDEAKRDKALARRDQWRGTLDGALEDIDAIALPVLTKTPLRMWSKAPGVFEAKVLAIQATVAANYAGNPALAVPVPLKGADFPVTSIQFIGPNRGEAELLNIGRLVEAR